MLSFLFITLSANYVLIIQNGEPRHREIKLPTAGKWQSQNLGPASLAPDTAVKEGISAAIVKFAASHPIEKMLSI